MSLSNTVGSEAETAYEGAPAPSDFQKWFMEEGAWWCASFVFHMLIMVLLMLFGNKLAPKVIGEAPSFEAADEHQDKSPIPPDKIEMFHLNKNTPLDASELSTDTLMLSAAPDVEATGGGDDSSGSADRGRQVAGQNLGGLGGFDIKAIGPGGALTGKGLSGRSGGASGVASGGGGGGHSYGNRTSGKKSLLGGFGGTKATERSVAAALNWIARHQSQNGSWSLDEFNKRCKPDLCSGPGKSPRPSAATALALLPFLAAGQTHEGRGPYKSTIYSGLWWLLSNQKPNGDLRAGGDMYSHGLASICLCEAYGLTGDKELGKRAQGAINFIQSAQNSSTGGWRYSPGNPGDTSVVGWQVMALKSGYMAGLKVDPKAFEGAKKFLLSMASGANKGLYGYANDRPPESLAPNTTRTAVGMLCQQYMGMKRDNPSMIEGVQYLMKQLPRRPTGSNMYYWYYATQVMHNMPGTEWDTWNRAMRHALIETQVRDGCATGSWDPTGPAKDFVAEEGGRLYFTSMATLTLEVYYRYLPLYKLDSESGHGGGGAAAAGGGAGTGRPNFDDDDKAPAKPAAKPAADAKAGAKPEAKPATGKPETKPAAGKPEAKPSTDPKAAAKPDAKPAPTDKAKPAEKK